MIDESRQRSSDDGAYPVNPELVHTATQQSGAQMACRIHGSTGGFLTQITNGDGNVTTIERDAIGNPTALVAPFGPRTSFTLDANGYLATISNPANESVQLAYSADGLLETLTDPRGNPSQFQYDSLGRLTRDTDAAGGFQDLARTELENGFEVSSTTALGRTTGHRVERLATGEQRRLTIFPEGTQTETIIGTDQSHALTFADGTTINTTPGPDPRFGMQTPILTNQTTTTPEALTSIVTTTRALNLSDPSDPLSLSSINDSITLNGRTFTSIFDAATLTSTETSPEGRQSTIRIDNQGRVVEVVAGNLLPLTLDYDPLGRLIRTAQGAGAEERATSFSYGADGFLASITDAEGRTVSFSRDLAGRLTTQTLPDSRVIAHSYDANGNVTSITPPGDLSTSSPTHLSISKRPTLLPMSELGRMRLSFSTMWIDS